MSLVEIRNLRIELDGKPDQDIVSEISFDIEAGEIVGLVGESGSGKTTIGTALLAYARRGAHIAGGEILVGGTDMLALSSSELTKARGRLVSYVPQDPGAGLNPARRIGRQLREALVVHDDSLSKEQTLERMRAAMAEVKLPSDDEFLERFPHQISGGQQQRVLIAMAFIARPKFIVLDEPTTGLDVTTQAYVLATIAELCAEHRVGAIYITHDLTVVKELADRVVVLYAGRIAEIATRDLLFERPAHPYSRGLLAAIPDVAERRLLQPIPGYAPAPGHRTPGCAFAPRCPKAVAACSVESEDLKVEQIRSGHLVRCTRAKAVFAEPMVHSVLEARPELGDKVDALLSVRDLDVYYGKNPAVLGVSIDLMPGECLALVGESGSGKTTLARTAMGLVQRSGGEVRYGDEALRPRARERSKLVRRELQYIFQNPYLSFNPRRTIGASMEAVIAHFYGTRGSEARKLVKEALARVSLPAQIADGFPRQLSGGERQRAAIARALACEPKVLICDEVTSALDVSVQASIIELLEKLREEQHLSMLFVTHNLAVVRSIADRVVVMSGGRILERGVVTAVLDEPQDPYTQTLVANSPTLTGSAAS